jgi:hypothetical protein
MKNILINQLRRESSNYLVYENVKEAEIYIIA